MSCIYISFSNLYFLASRLFEDVELLNLNMDLCCFILVSITTSENTTMCIAAFWSEGDIPSPSIINLLEAEMICGGNPSTTLSHSNILVVSSSFNLTSFNCVDNSFISSKA
eukprot:NODE_7_length_67686_cov_1.621421.p58 type:complete len:111 gc:universal NODE_7_length_67686_cov_1.621421:22711-22379(-)